MLPTEIMRTFSALVLVVAACSNSPAQAEPPLAAPPAAASGSEKDKKAGPHAEGQGFVVDVQLPAGVQVGTAAKAKVVLKPTSGYHVNKDFPTALTVSAPAGVEVGRPKLGAKDAAQFEEAGAVFEVEFLPKEAGTKDFTAIFKFAVCTATTCDPKNEKLAWSVPIK